MHTLFLLRHAQPAHSPVTGSGDSQRPLTAVGRRQAAEVGRSLELRGVDLTLCSSALRTRETFEATGLSCPVEVMRALYSCGVDTMRQRISEVGEEVSTLLVVGHAPTVPALAAELSSEDPVRSEEIARWYPPATLTEISLNWPWDGVLDPYRTGVLRGIQRL